MLKSIAILTDERCKQIHDTQYFLALMAEVWEQRGIRVHISAGCNYIPADLAILHVDSTVVDDEYLDLAARYPVVINGGVKDISKSGFSRNLLKRDDAYEGQVIVKTNANYGGFSEYEADLLSNNSVLNSIEIERPWRKRKTLDSYNYPVFDHINDVPQGVWRNNQLIVEKFLPERLDNGDYKHRCYLFFGEQEDVTWYAAPKPVFKGSTSTSRGRSEHIPESLRDARKSAGFDYGRFDYSMVDGEAKLFDMNKTPALSDKTLSLISEQMVLRFADAISDFE